MTKDEFWFLIKQLDPSRLEDEVEEGEPDPVTAPLVDALAGLPEGEITAFDDLLSEFLYELDGRDYALAAGVSGEYEDLFLYCRCVAVASGRAVYEEILGDPTAMPAGMEFERLLDCADRAWVKKTGRPYAHVPAFSLEMGANQLNWPA